MLSLQLFPGVWSIDTITIFSYTQWLLFLFTDTQNAKDCLFPSLSIFFPSVN